MPLLLFDYMRNQKKMQDYQKTFDKSQSEEVNLTQETTEAFKRSVCDDFARVVLLNKNLFVNNYPIFIPKQYIAEFNNRDKKMSAEEGVKFVHKIFGKILEANQIPTTKLDPIGLESFMNGFHQAGYGYALENTLKESLPTDPADSFRFKATTTKRLDISYDASKPQAINLKETVNIMQIADNKIQTEQDEFNTYMKKSRSEQEKCKPIAAATVTYQFAHDKIPALTKLPKLKPQEDTHNMLRHLPDDRTLTEKFKNYIANMFPSAKKKHTQPAEIQPEPTMRPRR